MNDSTRVLEKTLDHQLKFSRRPSTSASGSAACLIPLGRVRYNSHFAEHPHFPEVYSAADIATKRALISRLHLQRQ